MSIADRVAFGVTVLFLWLFAVALVGTALHSFEVVPSEYPFSLVISLMMLGGVLYLLSAGFVTYYGGIEFRLF